MKSKPLIVILAVLAILGAAVLLWYQTAAPRVNLRPSAAAGEVLAEEVGRLLGGAGGVVILSRQARHEGPDATRERVASLTAALQHHGALKLAGSELVPRPAGGMMDMGGVTEEQFLAAVEKHPDAKAIVVFAGLPPCSQPLVDKLAAGPMRLVAVCGYGPTVRRWLESKALAIAVVPRMEELPPGTAAPRTTREWFEREFQIVTPESVGKLPY
jgi:hypothetical protein